MGRVPKGATKIYDTIEEIKAIKGKESLWPNEPFKHDFKSSSRAAIYGLRDGSILVKSQDGKRLWKNFNYDESDGTRSNPMKRKRNQKGESFRQTGKRIGLEDPILSLYQEYMRERFPEKEYTGDPYVETWAERFYKGVDNAYDRSDLKGQALLRKLGKKYGLIS